MSFDRFFFLLSGFRNTCLSGSVRLVGVFGFCGKTRMTSTNKRGSKVCAIMAFLVYDFQNSKSINPAGSWYQQPNFLQFSFSARFSIYTWLETKDGNHNWCHIYLYTFISTLLSHTFISTQSQILVISLKIYSIDSSYCGISDYLIETLIIFTDFYFLSPL